jgi:DNA-binding transcriptional LysR family regulator
MTSAMPSAQLELRPTPSQEDRWLGLELRHLSTFHAVAEEASFSRAAARLGYTQSGVSHQIAALERIVGVRLIERPGGPKAVSLTEHGAILFRHAVRVLQTLAVAQADVQRMVRREARLRVGTFESIGAKALPTIVRKFGTAFSETALELFERRSDRDLLRALELGDVDLSFAVLPLPDPEPFQSVELMNDSFVLLVPPDSELAKRKSPPTLAELARLPLISCVGCPQLEALKRGLRSRGVAHEFRHRIEDNSTVQAMVASGIGAAVVPRLAVVPASLGASVQIPVSIAPRVVGVAWRRERTLSRTELYFIALARSVCASL